MSEERTVFVVDDDAAIRKSLRFLLESVDLKVETYASAREFLEHYDPEVSGCLVLDVRMKGMSGLELQEQLRDEGLELPIIILTGHGDVPMAVRAMKAGAVDFLQKPVSDQVLLDHIQHALNEDARRRESRAEHLSVSRRIEKLTKREHEVLKLVVAGMSSKEIAVELEVSFKTIEAHRSKVMKKMRARTVPHLIRMCMAPAMPVP